MQKNIKVCELFDKTDLHHCINEDLGFIIHAICYLAFDNANNYSEFKRSVYKKHQGFEH